VTVRPLVDVVDRRRVMAVLPDRDLTGTASRSSCCRLYRCHCYQTAAVAGWFANCRVALCRSSATHFAVVTTSRVQVGEGELRSTSRPTVPRRLRSPSALRSRSVVRTACGAQSIDIISSVSTSTWTAAHHIIWKTSLGTFGDLGLQALSARVLSSELLPDGLSSIFPLFRPRRGRLSSTSSTRHRCSRSGRQSLSELLPSWWLAWRRSGASSAVLLCTLFCSAAREVHVGCSCALALFALVVTFAGVKSTAPRNLFSIYRIYTVSEKAKPPR